MTDNDIGFDQQFAEQIFEIFQRLHTRDKYSGTVIGGVVVGPRASELIFAVSLAVHNKIHVDSFADTFTVYPSLSGSLSEAARRLHVMPG